MLISLRRFPQHRIPQKARRRAVHSARKLSRHRSLRSQSTTTPQRSRTQQASPAAFKMVPPDHQLPLRRLWFHPLRGMHSRLHRLETSWRPSSNCQPGSRDRACPGVGGTSCLLFLARLFQLTCHGLYHWHASRSMYRTQRRPANSNRWYRGRTRRHASHHDRQQTICRCSLRRSVTRRSL